MVTHGAMIDEPTDGQTARMLEQLMQIAKMSALEEMASGIAHELNQPIGAIATFAQAAERMLAKPQADIEPVRDVLRHISSEAMNAGQGIHRIRKLFDNYEAERATCDIAEIVAELAPVLQLLAQRAGVLLTISIDAPLPRISVDRLRIQHVLFALVQNALEATTADAPAPQVGLDINGDRHHVMTAVIDHGSGVSKEARPQLFRPFFTTKITGTGLGLASARAIVEMHDGSIGFDQLEDGGTRFWFRLPAAVDTMEAAQDILPA